MPNKVILKAHNDIQNIYKSVIVLIEDDSERNIIHCLFQDLSDKLMDNINGCCNHCEGKGYYNLSANYDDIDSRIECEYCRGSDNKLSD